MWYTRNTPKRGRRVIPSAWTCSFSCLWPAGGLSKPGRGFRASPLLFLANLLGHPLCHLLSFDFIIPYITGYVKRFSELYSVYFAQTYPVIHMGFVYIRLIKTVLYYSLEVIHRGRIQKEKKRSRTGSGQPCEKLRSSWGSLSKRNESVDQSCRRSPGRDAEWICPQGGGRTHEAGSNARKIEISPGSPFRRVGGSLSARNLLAIYWKKEKPPVRR